MKKLALLLAIVSMLCVAIFVFTSCGCEHNYVVKSTQESTCSTLGSTVYQCTLCNGTKTQKNSAYGEHAYTQSTVKATCLEGGYVLNSCINCPNTFRSNQTETAEHNYSAKYTKEATCTSTGYVDYECTVCKDTYTESLDMLDHDYEIASEKKATCTSDGYVNYECSLCNDTYTETTTSGGHNYTKTTKSATCLSYASTVYQCKDCSYNYSETTGTKLASHSGRYTCTTCGYSFRTILIAWLYENGTYSYSSNAYIYSDSLTNEGSTHYIYISYLVDDDNLAIMYQLSDTTMTILFNNAGSGTYAWGLDALGYQMIGSTSASSIYSSTTYLSYYSFDGYSSLTSSYQKLAASYFKSAIIMADLVLLASGENFSMYNFGFIYLSDPV